MLLHRPGNTPGRIAPLRRPPCWVGDKAPTCMSRSRPSGVAPCWGVSWGAFQKASGEVHESVATGTSWLRSPPAGHPSSTKCRIGCERAWEYQQGRVANQPHICHTRSWFSLKEPHIRRNTQYKHVQCEVCCWPVWKTWCNSC